MITILTPTYNREKNLNKLYESLSKQSVLYDENGNCYFEWLVVDDGSTDGTRKYIDSIVDEATFPIKYIYKNNGGKHTALNIGINSTNNELIMIVDSDDFLTDDAIQVIISYHRKYREDDDICGYAFLRKYSNGMINGKTFFKDELKASYIDSRINSDDTHSDKAEVFKTKYLKAYPFPEFDGERFLGEDVVWIRMAREYKMVHINKAIYVGEYLDGGLTNNRRKNNIESPNGCMCRAKEFMKNDIKLKYRIKGTLQFIIYGKYARYRFIGIMKESNNKCLTILCYVPALFIYYMWEIKHVLA